MIELGFLVIDEAQITIIQNYERIKLYRFVGICLREEAMQL